MKLMGIAGGTSTGKSTLLRNLSEKLGNEISTLSFDEYFIGSDLYNLDDITNFEDPKLYNYEQFIQDLKDLKNGKDIKIRANSRESSEAGINGKTIANKPIVIVEGWLIYYWPEARALFDKKIFIHLSDEEILKRRFARTKGSKHWDSYDYIENKIIPGHHKYVEPQKEYADLVLDGSITQEKLTREVVELVHSLLPKY